MGRPVVAREAGCPSRSDRAKVGKANVNEFAYEDEGDTYQAYEVRFKHGRAAKLYLSHFEITSIDFRTREGLGIGSTWKEFKKAYADGQLSWGSDAKAVWSERFKFRLYFEGDHEPVPQDHVTRIDVNRSVVRW